tara:strand:+ start:107 stop:712 length:606 start_codon:yes stop_codon:yes gene_type:complete
MSQFRGKYRTVKVSPKCVAASVANGNIIFPPTEIPGACHPGGTSLLKQIRVFDKDDLAADLELLFFETLADTEFVDYSTSTTSVNFTISGGNATDTEVEEANPLAFLTMDISEYADTTVAGGTIIKNKVDFSQSRSTYDSGNLDIFVKSNPSQALIDTTITRDSQTIPKGIPGSIFFMGISTATKTYTNTSYTFEFVFEIY